MGLCCDSCPSSYHLRCCDPPMEDVPDGEWTCPRCACEPLVGKVEKILTWRWAGVDEEKEDEEAKAQEAEGKKKRRSKEIQLDVFHPQTDRMYLRKNDMDEPPRFDEDGDDEVMSKKLKHHKKAADPYKIQERFIRYGIRPD